jgi:hypothetical protein
MADLDTLFETAPKPVVDYFDRRPSVPTWRWTDLAPQEHALGFTAAKTAGFDVIDDLRAALRQAVVDRMPFEDFQRQLTPVLMKKGWWGSRTVRRPDGHREKVELGSPRRLQIMYWANVASAEAAGEWQRIQETKDFLPNLRYLSSVSERKRPLHLSWVGTTLPADHPWWRTHFPPNGWNCKCRVEQIGEDAAKLTKPPKTTHRTWTNKHTGETQQVPEGIDPGWQTNPGIDRERRLSRGLVEALGRLPEGPRAEAVGRIAASPLLDHVAGSRGDPDFRIPIGSISARTQELAQAETPVVQLSGYSARHILADHADHVGPAELRALPDALRNGQSRLARNGALWIFFLHEGQAWRATIRPANGGAELFVTTMHRARQSQLDRAGVVLEREKKPDEGST